MSDTERFQEINQALDKAGVASFDGNRALTATERITELRKDKEQLIEINKTRYQDGYDAAAGPLAAERIERLRTLWEGAKASNRKFLEQIAELTRERDELREAWDNLKPGD